MLDANERLLAALSERRLSATGFVICGNASGNETVLKAWIARGMALGNHTAHHLDLHGTEPSAWARDVEDCHAQLAGIAGSTLEYFRYPMLHQGLTEAARRQSQAVLSRLGYRVAHVTVDNSEWLLARAYDRALSGNNQRQRTIIAYDYVEHVLGAVRHFDQVAEAELGRAPPHVLLLHVNALAADHLGALLDVLIAAGIEIVPLGEALADPIYSLPDVYEGPKGVSWLYRVRPGAYERWGHWDEEQADRIRARYLVGDEAQ